MQNIRTNEPFDLTTQEQLVFQYLKDRCSHGDSIAESHGQIARNILDMYPEEVRVTKKRIRKDQDPAQFDYAEKQFSPTTVSRAIEKLRTQGFISVLISKDKSKANEIMMMNNSDLDDVIDLFDQDQKRFMSRLNQMVTMIQTEREYLDELKQKAEQLDQIKMELEQSKQQYQALIAEMKKCIIFKRSDIISNQFDQEKNIATVSFYAKLVD